jgi:hypothetical protein
MHSYRFMIRPEFPYEIRSAIRKAEGDAIPERCMYRAIVCRAVADAYGWTGCEDIVEHNVTVREAREWFHFPSEDFDLILACSGIDPKPLVAAMLKLSPESLCSRPSRKKSP